MWHSLIIISLNSVESRILANSSLSFADWFIQSFENLVFARGILLIQLDEGSSPA